jgi:hypothetical protein
MREKKMRVFKVFSKNLFNVLKIQKKMLKIKSMQKKINMDWLIQIFIDR